MKAIFFAYNVAWVGLLFPLASAQFGPATFPLAGDWEGVLTLQGTADHLMLHMKTTPEGR